MNRLTLLFFLIFSFFAGLCLAQKEIPVNYDLPYAYQNREGRMEVKAWIDATSLPSDFDMILDGKKLSLNRKEQGRIELYLPLAGPAMKLEFVKNNPVAHEAASSQIFTPLVPVDWGYFGKGTVHIICSSHQDIAWMDTPDYCRHERIHDIVVPALDIIEKNPGFRFEMEQTLNLMEVLDEKPSEKQRIIDAYKTGQFTWGATFNQPYEGLESGEQLVRQTYLGRKWILDNLPGMDAHAAYNIDVPGRTLQYPQILHKAGIKYLFVSRMKEGFYNWYSPDGSRILTYSPGNYGWSLLVYRYFEDDAVTALRKLNKVMQNWNEYYATRNIPPHYAIVISTDAGGPKDYTPIIDEWNAIAETTGFDIPRVRHSTAEDFLAEIDVPQAKFDSISGDRPNLWLYIHGPAHYQAISAKKAAAVSLPSAEKFAAIEGMLSRNFSGYPAQELEQGWYNSIYPDHGWGGKNGEITDSIFRASLEQGNAAGEAILQQSLAKLSARVGLKNSNSILVYNNLSWSRSSMATVDISIKKEMPG
jgi:alpha-mannosidase